MAHVSKYVRAATGALFAHYERKKDKHGNYIKLQNQEIDFSKSYLNYNLCDEHKLSPNLFLKNRLNTVHHNNRKTQIVMIDWIITLPDEVKKSDERLFFQSCYEFCKDMYGKENIVGSWVHLDETTPHMHVSITPVINGKFDCKSIINRKNLQEFHPKLKKYVDGCLGYDAGILNGITKKVGRSKSVEELKQKNEFLAQKNIILNEKQNELIEVNKKLEIENSELEKVIVEKNEEIYYLKGKLSLVKERINYLLDIISPLEILKNILEILITFSKEFKDKLLEITKRYNLTSDQSNAIESFYDFIDTDCDITEVIDTIKEISKDIER